MDILEHIHHTDTGAHAYLLRASVDDTHERLLQKVIEKNNLTRSNPDLYVLHADLVAVDDARRVQQFAAFKPVGTYKYVIISAKQINTQAQHALLKVVEEGVGNSIFYLLVEPGSYVLDTLSSRCVTLSEGKENNSVYEEARTFLDMNYKDRLQRAENFSKNQDREGARALVRELLHIAHSENYSKETLRDLLDADRYLQLSGSSPKGVIGHLALIL